MRAAPGKGVETRPPAVAVIEDTHDLSGSTPENGGSNGLLREPAGRCGIQRSLRDRPARSALDAIARKAVVCRCAEGECGRISEKILAGDSKIWRSNGARVVACGAHTPRADGTR